MSDRFLLGHGTENDFVVLPDPDGDRWPEDRLDAALVRRLCERRAGLGGDGVLRVVRSAHVPVSRRSSEPAARAEPIECNTPQESRARTVFWADHR